MPWIWVAIGLGCGATANVDGPAPGGGGVGAGASSGGAGAAGASAACTVPGDCPGEDTSCRQRACQAGNCKDLFSPAGTQCQDEGGQRCDGQGRCVECLANDDCAAAKPICSVPTGNCVECSVKAHCDGTKPGTLCSLGACVCPDAAETWCAPDGCVAMQGSSVHCGACGHGCASACKSGECAGWEAVSGEGTPTARWGHVAVWTGKQMVVWGGAVGPDDDAPATNSGGMYDSATSKWTATSLFEAPSARVDATAVWTGEKMIVWGGRNGPELLDSGGIFDPATNEWTKVSTKGAPSARIHHTATWHGKAMVVLGGFDGSNQLASGGAYFLASDTWFPTVPAKAAREQHTAVLGLDGSLGILLYGGIGDVPGQVEDAYLPSPQAPAEPGGRAYAQEMLAWKALPTDGQPSGRAGHAAAVCALKVGWTMVVWGGRDAQGSVLATGAELLDGNQWVPMGGTPPEARSGHTAVCLDSAQAMVVWGGVGADGPLASGGVYQAAKTWTAATPATTLLPRWGHSAVSVGKQMVVWGGRDKGQVFGDGGVLTP